MKPFTAVLLISIILAAGCVVRRENVASNGDTSYIPQDFQFLESRICAVYSQSSVSECGSTFNSTNNLYYYVRWTGTNPVLKLYRNNVLVETHDISSTVLPFSSVCGGSYSAQLLSGTRVVDIKNFSIIYSTPVRLSDVITRTANTDSDPFRDALEVLDLYLYDANSCSLPLNGTLIVTFYGISFNSTTGLISHYNFLDRWETPIETFSSRVLLQFHDNTTNVFDYDYGQISVTLRNGFGNFSTFNPHTSLAQ